MEAVLVGAKKLFLILKCEDVGPSRHIHMLAGPPMRRARPAVRVAQVCSDTSMARVPGSRAWKMCGTSAG